MRCTATPVQAVVMTLARTAIIVPVDPAKAAAAGTTQNPLLGLTAQASSDPSPALRRPRVANAAPSMSHNPADRAMGPTSSPAEVSRQAATSESEADVTRIWTRRATGQTRWTPSPPCAAPQPRSPAHQEADQAEHSPDCAPAAGRRPPRWWGHSSR